MLTDQSYRDAIAAGDWRAAEAALRDALRENRDSRVVLELGRFLRKRGRLAEADAHLAAAAENAPCEELLDLLAQVQFERRSFAASEKTLERLVTLAPGAGLQVYQRLIKLRTARRGAESMREIMFRAMEAHRGDTEFVAAYADTLPPEEAVAVIENHIAEVRSQPAIVAYLLLRITAYLAPILRRRRGLPSYGVSWTDTIQWPDPEHLPALKEALRTEIALGSPRAGARLDLAHIALSESNWDLAESFYAELRNSGKRTSADFIAVGSSFHAHLDQMSHADIVGGLPPIKRLITAPLQTGENVFMASDPNYFMTFTLPFLRQLEDMKIPADLHVHILDGEETVWKEVYDAVSALRAVGVTLTAEASGALARGGNYARYYYHSVRYVRLYEELHRSRRPMWVLDCDVQLRHDPRPLFSSLQTYDIALKSSPCATDPIVKFTASSVGVSPTERGLEFARRVASSIIHWKDRGTWSWGVDQTSLYSSYAHMADQGRMPRTLFLDDQATSDRDGNSGAIRFLSGIAKFTVPAAGSAP